MARKSKLNMYVGLALGSALGITVFGHHAIGGGHVTTTSKIIHGRVQSGTLGCTQLEQLWVAAGGKRSDAFMAAEIARAESSGRQYARDPVSGGYANGSADFGYWQINSTNGGSDASYDPLTNARQAVSLHARDGWYPWITWRHGAENGQC